MYSCLFLAFGWLLSWTIWNVWTKVKAEQSNKNFGTNKNKWPSDIVNADECCLKWYCECPEQTLSEHASWEWGFNTAPRWHVCYSHDFSLRLTVRLCGESIVTLYSVACIFSLFLPFNQNILLTIWILLLGFLALARPCCTCFLTELTCLESILQLQHVG